MTGPDDSRRPLSIMDARMVEAAMRILTQAANWEVAGDVVRRLYGQDVLDAAWARIKLKEGL